nr:hypothetical protein [Nocardia bhagyanarayanae]
MGTGDAVILDRLDSRGDGLGAVLDVGEEFAQVGDGGGLDLVEYREVDALVAQQALQFAVELFGVAAQRLEVGLEFGECGEHAAIRTRFQLPQQIGKAVGDRVEDRGL